MNTRRLHKIVGLILLLPFIAWSATAVFFLVRPAYADAYARLEVRQYPLEASLSLAVQPDWQELRYFRSVLGEHLLVKRGGAWSNLDPRTSQEAPWPAEAEVRRLVEDAMRAKPERYGRLVSADGRRMRTDTGVDITFDWHTFSFTQEGRDSRWIDRIYSIHYLEWTGIGPIDKFLGLFGLFLLMYMTWTGAKLAFGWDRARPVIRSARQRAAGEAG